jgi:LPXTG-motif cell wall-anchored protein
VNHLCDVCARDADCASGLCRNGICLNAGLPLGAACNEDRQCVSGHCINGLCAPADHTAPTQTLPATVIELPFMTDVQKPFSENQEPYADGWIDWDDGTDGSAITKGDIPSTPSTGPAALGVMLAGAAAGWLYRRRK